MEDTQQLYIAPVEKHHKVKRIVMVTDTHFGIRSNSVEWMEIQRDYFYNWFIPMLKKNKRPGDALVHIGDVFDSRQSLNLKVMNMAMEIFEEISKIMPIFVICGNHDIYHKKSNSINSIKMFNWLKNVHVYEEPVLLEINGGKNRALLMPWRDTKEQEQNVIDSNDADYLFCHTDIRGLKFNSFVKVEDGNDTDCFDKFKRTYSGHIHYAQVNKNIRMVGSPYQLTRSDIGNVKQIWYLDVEQNEEHGIVNDYSPQFMRIKLEKVLELKYKEVKTLVENNFVDILVHSSWATNFPFNTFLESFTDVHYRKLNYIITTMGDGDEIDLEDGENYDQEVDLPTLIDLYIDSLSYKDATKLKLKEVSRKLYYKSVRSDQEETIG
jgi:DNA repair exonuclease SbcCD nuclease subunit